MHCASNAKVNNSITSLFVSISVVNFRKKKINKQKKNESVLVFFLRVVDVNDEAAKMVIEVKVTDFFATFGRFPALFVAANSAATFKLYIYRSTAT